LLPFFCKNHRKEERTMRTFGKTIRTGVAAALLLAGITTGVRGDIGVTPGSFGPGGGGIQIRGKVVCAGCSLAEAQKAQPGKNHLYQLTHKRGQVVMNVNWASNSQRWNHLTFPRIRVRGEDREFEKLTAEENLFKEAEVSGLLNSSQVLDLSAVTIRG
jgi:hypothetical protein